MSREKLEALRNRFKTLGSCVVAYSGGVDSVFLAWVAHDVLADRMLAVIADSPSLPRAELQEAKEVAAQFGIPLQVVRTTELEDGRYAANSTERCYFCKHELFTHLAPLARAGGFAAIVYGENASDLGDHRPGARAAAEFQVLAPLKETGFTKEEIRDCSRALGLPTSDKPQLACLSSRVPYGEVVTPEKLRMIEAAESCLRELGFVDVRVRHHELKVGCLARIELGPSELGRFMADGAPRSVGERLRELGYLHVTLDVLGYRRGSTFASVGLGLDLGRSPQRGPSAG